MDKAVLEPHVPAPGSFCQNRVSGISDRRHNHERRITYAQVGLTLNFGIAAKDFKRDDGHGCPYPILDKLPRVGDIASKEGFVQAVRL